jgi:hypothetical protein
MASFEKNDLGADIPMLDEDKLPLEDEIITRERQEGSTNNVSISTARSTDIASFISKTGFSINKKKMRRLMEMDEKAYESFKLEAFISKCCRVIIHSKVNLCQHKLLTYTSLFDF